MQATDLTVVTAHITEVITGDIIMQVSTLDLVMLDTDMVIGGQHNPDGDGVIQAGVSTATHTGAITMTGITVEAGVTTTQQLLYTTIITEILTTATHDQEVPAYTAKEMEIQLQEYELVQVALARLA